MMYVAVLQITKDVTQLIDYSQVSPVVKVRGWVVDCTWDMRVSTL